MIARSITEIPIPGFDMIQANDGKTMDRDSCTADVAVVSSTELFGTDHSADCLFISPLAQDSRQQ